uniref:Uncharacterized protein n=1 Tax=Molossus molossus TaxID=27622 RepID=A0A7J8CZJ9_MOLMO|nr:hypothetical protein HJG59_009468 [Molossus molossus]
MTALSTWYALPFSSVLLSTVPEVQGGDLLQATPTASTSPVPATPNKNWVPPRLPGTPTSFFFPDEASVLSPGLCHDPGSTAHAWQLLELPPRPCPVMGQLLPCPPLPCLAQECCGLSQLCPSPCHSQDLARSPESITSLRERLEPPVGACEDTATPPHFPLQLP